MTNPATLEFRHWAEDWLRGRGYEVQDGLPWKEWKAATPTIIYALDGNKRPVFGLLGHSVKLGDLVKRLGIFMTTKPCPAAVFVFIPRNSRLHVNIKLEGGHTYPIKIIESPDYDGYAENDYEDPEWRSSFSISLRARKPPE